MVTQLKPALIFYFYVNVNDTDCIG